jgi:hypothetical protein
MRCPYCAAFHPVIKQLLAEYPDDLQVIDPNNPVAGVEPDKIVSITISEE